MKNLAVTLSISIALVMVAVQANAQTDQTSTSPPLSQALVREGDFALKLADSLKLGSMANETEAESALGAVGIAPRNGWIADYPVTPDIVGELQTSVSEAADAGGLKMGKDEALSAFQDVVNQFNLNVQMDTSGSEVGDTSGAEYPDSAVMNEYYTDEGPPVVTYYAPPPDYAYLYTWVPYPFWWWNYWFPGFFVLVDFDVRVHHHGHDHGRDHGRGHGRDHDHDKSVSNHHRDPQTGRTVRVDPTTRSSGGTLPAGAGSRWSTPSGQSGARGIVGTRSAPSGQVPPGTTGRASRGYGGNSRSSAGTRSSAFDRSGNSQVERSSGGRGFQSRSNAGQVGRGSVGGRGVQGGGSRGPQGGGGARIGGAGGSRSSGSVSPQGGGGTRGSGSGGTRGGGGGFGGGRR